MMKTPSLWKRRYVTTLAEDSATSQAQAPSATSVPPSHCDNMPSCISLSETTTPH